MFLTLQESVYLIIFRKASPNFRALIYLFFVCFCWCLASCLTFQSPPVPSFLIRKLALDHRGHLSIIPTKKPYMFTLRNRCACTIISIPNFLLSYSCILSFKDNRIDWHRRYTQVRSTGWLWCFLSCVCVCLCLCVYVYVFSSVCARVHIGDKRTILSVLL